jgi:hypothetical protein
MIRNENIMENSEQKFLLNSSLGESKLGFKYYYS